MPIPERDGYTFIGWYSEREGGIHITATTPLVGVSAIYAHWAANPPSLVDSRDGKSYREVAIGEQIWMAENLDYETANSGCYRDSSEYCEKYGRLYEWSAAMSACPAGWHLPDENEWAELIDFVGEPTGMKLRSATGWRTGQVYDYNGTDNFGFSALPGGYYNTTFGPRDFANFWSASTADNGEVLVLEIHAGITNAWVGNFPKSARLSVRCLQD